MTPPTLRTMRSEAVTAAALLDRVELGRLEASGRLARDAEWRAELGQFFTPLRIATFMAEMFTPTAPRGGAVRVLDAGGGSGMLTAALVQTLCGSDDPPESIEAEIWEIDKSLREDLDATVAVCRALCDERGVGFEARVHYADFIDDAVTRLDRGPLFGTPTGFDLAILNPPYRKLRSDTRERSLLRSVGIETSNLYAAFVWLAVELLNDGGQLVAITPRSFMNGTYFRPFRQRLKEAMRFRRVHVYDSRTKAFAGDDVLQENAIVHAEKGGAVTPIRVTTSNGPDDEGLATREVPADEFIRPDDPEAVVHVVPDETDARIGEAVRALPCTLQDLGVTVSTGRVVDFRAKDRLHAEARSGDVPLIYPRHLADGFAAWPHAANGKPNAIAAEGDDDPLLLPRGWYVLIKRFSAKEERRRVVASLYDPDQINAERVGFDNKLNVLHINQAGLPEPLAKGLAAFLNGTLIDAYFRQFSGHTQVNAGDLRALRFPGRAELEALGGHVNGRMPAENEINQLIRREVKRMSEDDDPVAAKQKAADALNVLKAIKAPKAQQNERSALTLLGLLDLEPEGRWGDVSAPLRGVTELMDWMANAYGKKYAPNTRETIRRFTLHQFVEMGLVLLNPDEPGRPTNSPKNVYQIEPSALALLKSYGAGQWEKKLAAYLKSMEGTNRLREKARTMEQVPVTLPDGTTIELSAGGQNVLIKEVIEQFAPRFTPGGRVVYIGDAGEKHLVNDTEYFAELGVEIDPHDKMPDVVIHYAERDWLILVEAVTSHGPVNMLRHNQLKDLFAGSRAGLVFVTTFLDRQAMRQYLPEIAWETEVWVADAPTHLIHFNGERFLGPYPDRPGEKS